MTSKKKTDDFQFEQALKELEKLVGSMERGDQKLEDALKTFERGVTLVRECQQALSTAEQKVNILLKREGKETLKPFKDPQDS